MNKNNNLPPTTSVIDIQLSTLADLINSTLTADQLIPIGIGYGGLGTEVSLSRGYQVVGIVPFRPGTGQRIHIPSTLATGELYGVDTDNRVNAANLHIIADLSYGLRATEGVMSLQTASIGVLATAAALGVRSGTNVHLTGFNDAFSKLLSTGNNDTNEMLASAVKFAKAAEFVGYDDTLDKTLSRLKYEVNSTDFVTIISDFRKGYSTSSDEYSWESELKRLRHLEDRLTLIQLDSPSLHTINPLAIKGSTAAKTAELTRVYHDLDAKKVARLQAIFSKYRHLKINLTRNDQDFRQTVKDISQQTISFLSK